MTDIFTEIYHNSPILISILTFLVGSLLGHRLGYSLAILRDDTNRKKNSLLESNKEYRKAFVEILNDFKDPEVKQSVALFVRSHFDNHKKSSTLYSMELSGKKRSNFLKVWEKYNAMSLEFMELDRIRNKTDKDLIVYKDLVEQLSRM